MLIGLGIRVMVCLLVGRKKEQKEKGCAHKEKNMYFQMRGCAH